LKQEQEEYAKEGIEWVHVEFFNNAIILELIESQKNGLIVTLDEECMRPGNASDKTFLEKLNKRHEQRQGPSEYLETKELVRTDKTIPFDAFRLKHYAGNVIYDINGFMDKNMDNLSRDLKDLMNDSNNLVVRQLFKSGHGLGTMGSQTNLGSTSELKKFGSSSSLSVSNNANESTKRLVSTATSFKTSLNQLVNTLLSKQPHYIRCIKSNDSLSPNTFDMQLCSHQTRYLGLMENLRVKRAGFVYRETYEKFLDRYRVVCPKVWPSYKGSNKDAVDVLLKFKGISSAEYRLGQTKLFIRKPNTLFKLEDDREASLPKCQVLIAKVWKGYLQRQKFYRMRAATRIVLYIKKWKFRKYFTDLDKTFKNVAKSEVICSLNDLTFLGSWKEPCLAESPFEGFEQWCCVAKKSVEELESRTNDQKNSKG
jgi:myosin-1